MALSDKTIQSNKAGDKPYKVTDRGGLYLLVQPNGSKLWRYQFRFAGKQKLLALGRYPDLSLAIARQKHSDARRLLAQGIDPSEAKQAAKVAEKVARANSFASVVDLWIEQWSANKSKRHVDTTVARLKNDVLPVLGSTPVADISAQNVVRLVKEIEARGAREVAERVLMVIGQVLRYAVAHSYVRVNVAAMVKPSDILKPVKAVNYARVDAKELGGLLQAIEIYQGTPLTRLAMKLMALTVLRTNELIGLKWSDVDLTTKVITIPADRMKAAREHRVPLSKQAVDVLTLIKKVVQAGEHRSDYVFPGAQGAAHISNMTLLLMLKRMGYQGKMTGHGWRGVFSTVSHEEGHDHAVIELALAHVPQGVQAAYNHALYLDDRRELLQWWADYLDEAAHSALETESITTAS